VRVFDSKGNAVAYQVLANDRGLFSVQILNAVAGQKYTVQVFARAGATQSTGNYFFAADFNQVEPVFTFDNVANGTVNAGTTTAADTLALSETGAYQFALGASSAQAGNKVTMSVYDENGNLVFTLTSVAGQPVVTATQYLRAGTYYVTYSGAKTNTGATDYGMFLAELSDLSGPYATSTASPPSSTAPATTTTTSPTSTTSPSPSNSMTSSTSPAPAPSTTSTSPSSPTSTASNSMITSSSTQSAYALPPSSTQPSYNYSGSSTAQPTGYYYTY
jgi:hypothetical protein